ncbi:MAG: MerR family transcriptional regulator [Fusobacterium mortiferum]|jgi:DNA-binding transcriptional MerR regulator|nr:MerR family transcriptional regulator [Fusobacterium mortiferum]
MKKLYKIGDISKLYNISNDILRYYEKIGLLIPDVRGENGYRYYSESQLWKLNNIRSLRNLGVSLNEIIDFLNTRSIKKTKEMIKFQLKKIDENLRELLKLKEELELKKENIRYFEHFSDYEIPRIKYYPKRYILLKNGKFKDENEINLELKKLKRKSEEDNDFIFTESEIGTVIKLEEWEKGNYSDYIGTFIITNEIKENFLDEGEYLTYFFSGDYINLSKHYKKLKEFIRENNYRVCGNIIELYHIEMHITENKEEYVTEIQIPLEKNEKSYII